MGNRYPEGERRPEMLDNYLDIYSFCGVDGCGKTTQISKFAHYRNDVCALRVPQTYETPNTAHSEVSALLEEIGKFSDAEKMPLLKANASFLAFRLISKVIEGIERERRYSALVLERHPLLDALTYAGFYKKFIDMGMDESSAKIKLQRRFGDRLQKLDALQALLGVPQGALYSVHNELQEILKASGQQLFAKLNALIAVNLPKKILFLELGAGEMAKRLRSKAEAGESLEAHENVEFLLYMQKNLLALCSDLGVQCKRLLVDGLKPDEIHNIGKDLFFGS